jgi:hypothetical protein
LSLKQSEIPTLNYLEFRLVLTLEFASANSSASTHTNYLNTLLKSDLKNGSEPFFQLPNWQSRRKKGSDPVFQADPQLYRPSAIVG